MCAVSLDCYSRLEGMLTSLHPDDIRTSLNLIYFAIIIIHHMPVAMLISIVVVDRVTVEDG
jgi:hypothetical protein